MKIRTKLFIAILTFAALLVLAMYGVSRWKFENGFLGYVQQAELARLSSLADALESEYTENGSWQRFINDEQLWFELVQKNVSFRHPHPPLERMDGHHSEHHHMPPPDLIMRLVLADQNQHALIGRGSLKDASWQEIRVENNVVGYLGLLPRRELNEHWDKVFYQQQLQALGWEAAGAFLFSLLIAQILAHSLSRPLSDVAAATKILAGGDYRFRLPVHSQDELGQLCADFNGLAISLEKNQTERQTWLATFSHELRTPIAILHGEVEAMLEGVRPLTSSALQSLREEIERVARLVDDLYELSRSAVGTLSYRKSSVDLVELINQLIMPLNDTQTAIKFLRELPNEAMVCGDAVRLTQLIRNLIQNTLRYGREQGTAKISLIQNDGKWRLSWADDGPGVPEALLKRIFEPFFRNSNQTNTAGAGLGLAICKNIVEAHQGNIKAGKSALGGLEIQIEIPTLEGDE